MTANRGTMERFKEAFFKTVERIMAPQHHSVVCIQCHIPITGDHFVAKTKEGLDLIFCSYQCGHAYWQEYGQFGRNAVALQQGPLTCLYPGCTKPCFKEGTKVHSYCGRTHAQQHGAMRGDGRGGGGWNHKQNAGGYGKQGSPKLGSGSSSSFNQSGPIKFYNRGEPYYEFTNFYEVIVNIDGEDWLTTEHYFQAQKFVGTPLVGTIRMLARPREAFDKSRDPRYSPWRRSDWKNIKEDVMYKALQAKFYQHKRLGQQLRDTGDRDLIEHSPYDSYWGDGGDGTGKNRLGLLLMRLRDDMKPKLRDDMKPKLAVSAPSPPSPIHANRQYSRQDSVHRDSVHHDSGTTSTSKTSSSPSSSPAVACKQKQDDDGPAGQPPSRPRANSSNDQSNIPTPQPVNRSLSSDAQNSDTSISVSPPSPAFSSVSQHTHCPQQVSLTGNVLQNSTQQPENLMGFYETHSSLPASPQGIPLQTAPYYTTSAGSQPQSTATYTYGALPNSVQSVPSQPASYASVLARGSSQPQVTTIYPRNPLPGSVQRMPPQPNAPNSNLRPSQTKCWPPAPHAPTEPLNPTDPQPMDTT